MSTQLPKMKQNSRRRSTAVGSHSTSSDSKSDLSDHYHYHSMSTAPVSNTTKAPSINNGNNTARRGTSQASVNTTAATIASSNRSSITITPSSHPSTRVRVPQRPRSKIPIAAVGKENARQANDQLDFIAEQINSVEERTLSRQENLRLSFQSMEKDLRDLLDSKKNERTGWLNSMTEIEEKAKQTHAELEKASEEIKNLKVAYNKSEKDLTNFRKENSKIKTENQTLSEEIEYLQVKVKETKSESKKLKSLLRSYKSKQNNNDVKRTSKTILVDKSIQCDYELHQSKTISKFEALSEKVHQLLKKQSESTSSVKGNHCQTITISSPAKTQTVITTTVITPSEKTKTRKKRKEEDQIVNTPRKSIQLQDDKDIIEEKLIRELFFCF